MSEQWYELVETKAGWLIARGDSESISELSFPYTDHASALWVAQSEHPDTVRGGPAHLIGSLSAYLRTYFDGANPEGAVPVNLSRLPDFTRRVLEEAARIPWGTVLSYAEIAERVGAPAGARAVGQAMGRNPVPILVPCHRVVGSDGGLTGFGGGVCLKRRLLELEGLDPDRLGSAGTRGVRGCAG